MKFAFIENRYKTFFWDALAGQFALSGHEVVWLVQNPVFTPTVGRAEVIAFPRPSDLRDPAVASEVDPISICDRNVNYFGGNCRHYAYYRERIESWLVAESPEVVVGECTLFHELMVINWCKRNGVPFLHPTMVGYPSGRYTIYSGDEKWPICVNPEVPTDAECLAMAEAIRRRERLPDYMLPQAASDSARVHPAPRSLRDRLKVLRGFVRGERFNTPAPWTKWWLERNVRRHIAAWTKVSLQRALDSEAKRVVLYPLQMQPEANLDVWGREFRDQTVLVKALADALPPGWHLQVKANPKSKYELTPDLVELLRTHPNVSPVPVEIGMAEAFSRAELVCTVTGTVAVECLLSGKPLAQLGPGIVENGPGCVQMTGPSQIAAVIAQLERGDFPLATNLDRISLIRRLHATTFPGKVSDPASMPAVTERENVRRVAATVLEVARQCV